MKVLTPPNEFIGFDSNRLFIGGGISNCPDWQTEILDSFQSLNITCFNPRRKDFDVKNVLMSEQQVKWENKHLHMATEILFWFCKETLCPITLYELGAWSMTNKKLFVGVEPEYARNFDVKLQTELSRPEIVVVSSLKELSNQVIAHYRGLGK